MDRRTYRTLRVKIMGAILAFSLIPLFSLGYFIHTSFSDAYRDKVESALRIIMEDKRNALDMFLETSVVQLRNLAETHGYASLSNQAELARVFEVLKRTSKVFTDLGVIDEDGNHVAYAGPYKLRGLNYSQEPWFNTVMRRGVVVSDVFMGFRNYPHCIIAVLHREQEQSWTLRATFDSEVLATLVRGVPLGKHGEAFLVNDEGVLQTLSTRHGEVLGNSSLRPEGQFPGARIVATPWKDHALLTGSTWLRNAEWMLVVQEDPTEEMSPLFRTQRVTVFIILAGAVLVFTGCHLTSGAIVDKLIKADQEKAAMDAALLQSGKIAAIGKLAAGVAHEVNNPLTLIRESAGWIKDLLMEEDPEKIHNFHEIEESLTKIDQHVERARTVTHRLLGFARRMEPMQEHIDLNAVVEQTTKFLESEALYRNITIQKHFDPSLPCITTDPAQLQQVFLNLLENAIDAVDRNGVIVIASAHTVGEVVLSIADNGHGIPKAVQDRIFDPFFTTKKVGEGTGLGLSISYGIIEKLGGRITVESEEGKGATFRVHLPIQGC